MRGKSLTCRHENHEEAQVFDLSIDQIGVKDPEEKTDSNDKSETCRASERLSRKWTAQTIIDFPFSSQSSGKKNVTIPS